MTILGKTAAALIIAVISPVGYASDSEGIITMTSVKEGKVEFRMAGTGEAVIDWGDGSAPETVTLSAYDENSFFTASQRYSHTFPGTISRIIINGKNMTHLKCDDMELTALDVAKNTALIYLNCYNNRLTALNMTRNTMLRTLICSDNRLTSFDVTKNTALEFLSCYGNDLTSLDVTKNTGLILLNCGTNQLPILDVTKNTALEDLYCDSNRLTSLDVSNNTALTLLYCHDTQLTNLNVTKNAALKWLNCAENDLTAEGLNALFGTLHAGAGYKEIWVSGNPGAADCDKALPREKDGK